MTSSHADFHIVLTKDAVAKIHNSDLNGGVLVMKSIPSEELFVVISVETSRDVRVPVDIPTEYSKLRWGDITHSAQWMRPSRPDLHVRHRAMIRRPGTGISFEGFRELVPGVSDPGNGLGLMVTHDPGLSVEAREFGASEFAGWLVQRTGVEPISLVIEPEVVGIGQLASQWPIEQLKSHSVMLVGCGSIGGAAAEALAGYGIGRIELVDPDRFLWHNMVRHVLGAESVGRRKVDALKDHLKERWPNLHVETRRLDVVADAHLMRPLVDGVDLVLCAADGIAPRRVVSHLSRRAGKPSVLACVLDDGAIGEVIRLRPTPRFGCLLCHRQHLSDQGTLDPEADQELAYGTGQVHKPMTAVPPDLHYIGTLMAKIAIATLLESLHGDHTQRLPGEYALLGLRPARLYQAPFDLQKAGEIRWLSIPAPRPTCFTCGSA
jgi:molybdopterin/thiamine biosynthesis adenylyltransferase